MAKSTAVEKAAGTEVEALSAEDQALINAQSGEFGEDSLQVPILKVGQPLTREVQDEQAEAGEFINTLTGEGIGNKIDFIVSYYQKGRAAADRDSGRYYVAFGDTIPDAWADLPFVGEAFVGTRFDEHPDAEETYKERVNAKEIPWGKGPQISTTHNYTGLAIVPAIEGSDEPDEVQPVRLSLQRTNMPAVRKINSLYKMSMRNKPFWDKVFELTTKRKQFNQGSAFLVEPRLGRATTPDEKLEARDLALAVGQGRVEDNAAQAESASAPVEPDAKGGLEV